MPIPLAEGMGDNYEESLDADSVRKTGTEELKEMVLDVKEQARIM